MSITEKWQERLDLVDDDRPENMPEWRAWNTCMQDLHDATIPRPPQPEWFGDPEKEPGKWDAWWVELAEGVSTHGLLRIVRAEQNPFRYVGALLGVAGQTWIFHREIKSCVPVRRKGPPAMDVGWGFLDVRP